MKIIDKADKAVTALVNKVVKDWHHDLAKQGTTFDVLFVGDVNTDSGEVTDNRVLRRGGYAVPALVSITSYEHRVRGLPDACIKLDEYNWKKTLNAKERVAVLDHELSRLAVQMTEDGAKADDLGRPLLQLRRPDWLIGGFDSVVYRHENNAPEVIAMLAVLERDGQYILPFFNVVPGKSKASTAVATSVKRLRLAGAEVSADDKPAPRARKSVNKAAAAAAN